MVGNLLLEGGKAAITGLLRGLGESILAGVRAQGCYATDLHDDPRAKRFDFIL
jgi:hypothetical protein